MSPDGTPPDRASRPRLSTLEEHAAVYAAVVDAALDAVIVLDDDGRVVTINPAAESIFGYTRSEAAGQKITALIVPDHLKEAHDRGMARYRATGEPHVLGRRVEMDARCKDGSIIPVELAITEVKLPDGRMFTASLRDLSAAKTSAVEIERQRDALHQSEKLAAIGSLLAGVAHELNNPLSIVLGQATMLREEVEAAGGSASTVERAIKIEAAAERCARVIRSFLAIARQRKAETKAVAVPQLLDGCIELLLYGLQSNGISIVRDYDTAPDVRADPDQVQNIVTNLLVNAIQSLENIDGRREIRISARAGSDGQLRIVVADNGPGIPREIAQRIFDPFFTTKPQGVGTGIGLSISRGLAEAQGGLLAMVEQEKGGAAFELTLPLATPQSDAAQFAARTSVTAGSGETPSRRAIIIDDEVEVAGLLAETLTRAGYKCDVATGGREGQALIAAEGSNYDAVICDLRMPEFDGPALFRWIGAHHPDLVERTLFVTGDALGPVAGRFLAESRRPVLEKPFSTAEVAHVIRGFPQRER